MDEIVVEEQSEMSKLQPLATALGKLGRALRPGRRFDNLMRNFRSNWLVEHEYVQTAGGYICKDKVIYTTLENPAPEPPAAIKSIAKGYNTYLPPGELPADASDEDREKVAVARSQWRNKRKAARRRIRKAGGAVGRW